LVFNSVTPDVKRPAPRRGWAAISFRWSKVAGKPMHHPRKPLILKIAHRLR